MIAHDGRDVVEGRGFFLPSACLASAFVLWLLFQTWNLVSERSQLSSAYATQDVATEQARKIRASLDTLAMTTQRLSNEGSASARTVIDELAKRGVTINPSGAASVPR